MLSAELSQGILNHIDVLVIPNSSNAVVKKYLATKRLAEFMNNGGVVLSTGDAAEVVPAHKNFIKVRSAAEIRKHILK